MTILVVDDSRIMRNIIKNSLAQSKKYQNFECVEASDGIEAWHILEKQTIGLVLLDWNMPRLNGIELIRKLRADSRFVTLPIVMITSEAAKYNVIEAVKAGASDYLIKPVSDRNLIEKLDRVVT